MKISGWRRCMAKGREYMIDPFAGVLETSYEERGKMAAIARLYTPSGLWK